MVATSSQLVSALPATAAEAGGRGEATEWRGSGNLILLPAWRGFPRGI
jgi:hypothetical protein